MTFYQLDSIELMTADMCCLHGELVQVAGTSPPDAGLPRDTKIFAELQLERGNSARPLTLYTFG